jgi:sodium transport system permease protein
MPGVKLSAATQFVPIANVILLFRDMMTGKAELDAMFAVFLSTAAFAALALLFAAWLFQREEVVLSEEKGFPLTWRRSEFRPRKTLTPSMALGLFTVMLIMLFYIGSTVQGWRLLPGLLITEWLMLLAPLIFFLWYAKVGLRTSLNLNRLPWWGFLGSLGIGFFSIVLVIQLGFWFNQVLPVPKEFEEEMAKLFHGGGTLPDVLLLLFVAAVSPAICEEIVFRGAILTGLRQRLGIWPSIVLVGLLFGLFHISVFRIPPISVLGMVLTYLTLRTGSIYAGMLVHLMNNAFAILIATEFMPAAVGKILQLESFQTRGLPMPVLLVSLAGFAASVVFLEYTARRFHRPEIAAEDAA